MYIKARQVGGHQLLILDSHESHLNQDFKDYCLKYKILTLYIPTHSLYILQPLNIVYFSPLKQKYSKRVQDLARQRVFYINKEGFLLAFKDAFFNIFTIENYKKAFKAFRLVLLNAAEVLKRLKVRLYTLPEPYLLETPQ